MLIPSNVQPRANGINRSVYDVLHSLATKGTSGPGNLLHLLRKINVLLARLAMQYIAVLKNVKMTTLTDLLHRLIFFLISLAFIASYKGSLTRIYYSKLYSLAHLQSCECFPCS